MNAKTKELLYFLLWSCEGLLRPTFRNLTDSFEGWAYRNGLQQQLARLERQQLLESSPSTNAGAMSRMVRLTEAGRIVALGGRDPEKYWSRDWDGLWRIIAY